MTDDNQPDDTWIPVTDRQPPKVGAYWCKTEDGKTVLVSYDPSEREFRRGNGWDLRRGIVTHWRETAGIK